MHFTYQEDLCTTELCQGDVLERTPEINSLLELVHPHFHKKENNLFFMVLTQSCDLVPRGEGGACKAPYITIAPVRPIESVVSRQIASLQAPGIRADLPVLTDKAKTKLSEFLKRVYDNNESGYFFLDSADTCLPGDCCAYLNLSIAIKASEHYEKCIRAKRIQLTDTFQAKLGWLVGQMYSRVGTLDWDPKRLTVKIQDALENAAIWIPDSAAKALEHASQAKMAGGDGARMNHSEIKDTLKRVPSRRKQLRDVINATLTKALSDQLDVDKAAQVTDIAERVMKRLDVDAAFVTLTK